MPKENKNGKALSEENLGDVSGGGNFRPDLLAMLPPEMQSPFYGSFPNPPHKPLKNKNIEIGGNELCQKKTKMEKH